MHHGLGVFISEEVKRNIGREGERVEKKGQDPRKRSNELQAYPTFRGYRTIGLLSGNKEDWPVTRRGNHLHEGERGGHYTNPTRTTLR